MPTSTRYLGTCAACGGEFKVRGGRLVHHGYKRPGVGYIVGDCLGVNYPPHELSPELAQVVLEVATEKVEAVESKLAELPSRTSLPKRFYESPGPGLRARWVQRQVTPDDVSEYEWGQLYHAAKGQLQSELRFWRSEVERAKGLLKGWRKRPLRTVEEEQAQQRAAKSEREAAKLAKWQAQAEAKVDSYRKRLDSAFARLERAKNPSKAVDAANTISNIYEGATQKVRGTMRDRISFDEANEMLDLDEAWAALGLPPPSPDYRERNRVIRDWLRPYELREERWYAAGRP